MKVKTIRKISYRSSDAAGLPVPCLPLQGRHMEQYGFYLGETVFVAYERGKITIILIEKSLIKPIGGDQYGIQKLLPCAALNSYSQK
ncbi:MAG: hypothetical protein Q8P75_00405 [bacterium]|nr:hypothetical protein [bacterium]